MAKSNKTELSAVIGVYGNVEERTDPLECHVSFVSRQKKRFQKTAR